MKHTSLKALSPEILSSFSIAVLELNGTISMATRSLSMTGIHRRCVVVVLLLHEVWLYAATDMCVTKLTTSEDNNIGAVRSHNLLQSTSILFLV